MGWLPELMSDVSSDDVILVSLSGRGDKDLDTVMAELSPGH